MIRIRLCKLQKSHLYKYIIIMMNLKLPVAFNSLRGKIVREISSPYRREFAHPRFIVRSHFVYRPFYLIRIFSGNSITAPIHDTRCNREKVRLFPLVSARVLSHRHHLLSPVSARHMRFANCSGETTICLFG